MIEVRPEVEVEAEVKGLWSWVGFYGDINNGGRHGGGGYGGSGGMEVERVAETWRGW